LNCNKKHGKNKKDKLKKSEKAFKTRLLRFNFRVFLKFAVNDTTNTFFCTCDFVFITYRPSPAPDAGETFTAFKVKITYRTPGQIFLAV
jgi:hypothetical protein